MHILQLERSHSSGDSSGNQLGKSSLPISNVHRRHIISYARSGGVADLVLMIHHRQTTRGLNPLIRHSVELTQSLTAEFHRQYLTIIFSMKD